MHVLLVLSCVIAQLPVQVSAPASPPPPPAELTASAPSVPISVVYQTVGSPVVIEGTQSVGGRAHARVTLRNVSSRAVTGLTIVTTLGDTSAESAAPLRRLSEDIRVTLAPGAVQDVSLGGLTSTLATALGATSTDSVAELAVLQATFADGSQWVSTQPVGWVGHPDKQRPVECADTQARIQAPGEVLAVGARMQDCRADGVTVRR